jgi:SAM-dependent methyltransferase
MFVCPDCKTPLSNELFCPTCQFQFPNADGIPVLFTREGAFQQATKIGDAYNDIYARHSNVWNDQGRTPEFIEYFASLVRSVSTGSLLEIGCGEGFLLAALSASKKAAVDISTKALQQARSRTQAEFGAALAERLPFADKSFDVVVSVGVMEHFIDDRAATREIHRVLRDDGHYVMLLHVELSSAKRLALKFAEYIYPRFRPLALFHWLYLKATRSIIQPIQRRYTAASVRACLEECGLTVSRLISRQSDPSSPLSGPHVMLFVSEKRASSQPQMSAAKAGQAVPVVTR